MWLDEFSKDLTALERALESAMPPDTVNAEALVPTIDEIFDPVRKDPDNPGAIERAADLWWKFNIDSGKYTSQNCEIVCELMHETAQVLRAIYYLVR